MYMQALALPSGPEHTRPSPSRSRSEARTTFDEQRELLVGGPVRFRSSHRLANIKMSRSGRQCLLSIAALINMLSRPGRSSQLCVGDRV